jgi:hypothetical protein
VLLLLSPFKAEGLCSDETDSKLWIAQEISHGITDRLSFKLEFNERFYDDISRWEEFYIDTGIDYKLTDWLVLGPRYRYVKARFRSEDEVTENRFHMNIELIARLRRLSFEFRSRYEYRTFEDDTIKHRFTERIKMVVPLGWKIEDRRVEAYLSDELYYDIDNHEANNNEKHLGIKLPLYDRFSLKLYYGHEIKKRHENWNFHTHIIGITAAFNL